MPAEELRIARERIRRFERLGGVCLSRMEPEEQQPLLAEVEVGLAKYRHTLFHFRCPICGREEHSDMEMPPACTGPRWVDEHPLEPMVPKL